MLCSLDTVLETAEWEEAARAGIKTLPEPFRKRRANLLNYGLVEFTDDEEWVAVHHWAAALTGWNMTPEDPPQGKQVVHPVNFRRQ